MDGQRPIREERAALMRIANLLLVLATVAELACSRSPAVRGFVLWLVRHAESVARDFVAGSSPAHGGSEGRPRKEWWRGRSRSIDASSDARPAEAMRLAASLRALAQQLERQAMLMLARRGEGGAETAPPLGIHAMNRVSNALLMLSALGGLAVHPAPDTS